MTTITANSTVGLYLSLPSYSNPVVIDPGITVSSSAAAVSASGGTWTLQNGGTLTGGATYGAGIVFQSVAGVITNQSSGAINGDIGILAAGSAVTVVNGGSIQGNTQTGWGIYLQAGGSVTNQNAGLISGAVAIAGSGAPLTVVNDGGITGSTPGDVGIYLFAGGSVTNQGSGSILAAYGIESGYSGAVTVINSGTISGPPDTSAGKPGIGLLLHAGGYLSNVSGGTITGAYRGVDFANGVGTLVNAGSITGHATAGAGIYLYQGGGITNQAGGTISGRGGGAIRGGNYGAVTVVNAGLLSSSTYNGINAAGGAVISNSGSIYGALGGVQVAGAAGTLLNSGTITGAGTATGTGTGANAGIVLTAGGQVTNQAGGLIQDINGHGVYATGAAVSVLNAGLITAGTIAGDGVDLRTGGYVSNGATGTITASQDGVYIGGGAGTVIDTGGTITGGTLAGLYAVAFQAGAANRLALSPGVVINGRVTGGNSIGAAAVSTLELATGASAGTLTGLGSQVVNFGSIAFDAGADWSIAGSIAGLSGTISGFAPGDTIEVAGITVTGSSYAAGVLTLTEATGSVSLNLPGSFTTSAFVVTNVSRGAKISLECFCAGTRIRTPQGDVRVEELAVGAPVRTWFGGTAAVAWIGHRRIDCRTHPKPEQVWPVRVRAGAFGPGLPGRDLWLSPGHAVFVDDVLIPIGRLVNGGTIRQEPRDTVTYHHIELPQHDLLLAEGLAAESYLDAGDRANFANGDGAMRLFPDLSAPSPDAATLWEMHGCAPLIVTGPQVDTVRDRLRGRSAAAGVTRMPGDGMPGDGMRGDGMRGDGMRGTGMPGIDMPRTGMPGTGMPEPGLARTGRNR